MIGFVLAPIAEENLCAGLMASGGSYLPLITRPLSLCLLVGSIALILWKRKPKRTKTNPNFNMQKQPNILWYCTDQQRFDTIGALGNSFVRTPILINWYPKEPLYSHLLPEPHMYPQPGKFHEWTLPKPGS